MKRASRWPKLMRLAAALAAVIWLITPSIVLADDKGKPQNNATVNTQADNGKPGQQANNPPAGNPPNNAAAGNPPNNATNQTNKDNGPPGGNNAGGNNNQNNATTQTNSDNGPPGGNNNNDQDKGKPSENKPAGGDHNPPARPGGGGNGGGGGGGNTGGGGNGGGGGGKEGVKGTAHCAPSDPDGMANQFHGSGDGRDKPGGDGGQNVDHQDCNNGSGNDADCEDDNKGVGLPGHCKPKNPPEGGVLGSTSVHVQGCFEWKDTGLRFFINEDMSEQNARQFDRDTDFISDTVEGCQPTQPLGGGEAKTFDFAGCILVDGKPQNVARTDLTEDEKNALESQRLPDSSCGGVLPLTTENPNPPQPDLLYGCFRTPAGDFVFINGLSFATHDALLAYVAQNGLTVQAQLSSPEKCQNPPVQPQQTENPSGNPTVNPPGPPENPPGPPNNPPGPPENPPGPPSNPPGPPIIPPGQTLGIVSVEGNPPTQMINIATVETETAPVITTEEAREQSPVVDIFPPSGELGIVTEQPAAPMAAPVNPAPVNPAPVNPITTFLPITGEPLVSLALITLALIGITLLGVRLMRASARRV